MNLLAELVALVTGHKRTPLLSHEFKWRQDDGLFLVTNALFRVWELLAWRRAGIKPVVAGRLVDGVFTRKFFCLEARLVHYEATLQLYFKSLFYFLYAPTLLPMRGAVTFVAGTGSSNNITSSGSNIMIIGGINNIAGNIGTIQYNSVNANQIDHNNYSAAHDGYTYMLKNQAATSTWTNAGSSNWNVYCYNGVAQNDTAGTVDKHGTTTGNSTAPSGTLTPIASGSWVWCNISGDYFTSTISGFTNMANHFGQASPNSAPEDAGDSQGSAGAQTQSETLNIAGNWSVMQISMAPPAVASSLLTILGAG